MKNISDNTHYFITVIGLVIIFILSSLDMSIEMKFERDKKAIATSNEDTWKGIENGLYYRIQCIQGVNYIILRSNVRTAGGEGISITPLLSKYSGVPKIITCNDNSSEQANIK